MQPDSLTGSKKKSFPWESREYPKKFRQYEREPWKSRNTRVVPVDNYVIFYIPDKTKKLVTVIRVMYSGRDVDKQLDEFTKL